MTKNFISYDCADIGNYTLIPNNHFQQNILRVIEGANAVIEFMIDANPRDNTLIRADGKTLSSNIRVEYDRIVFNQTSRNDSGSYSLSTTNRAGSSSASFSVVVACKFRE